MENKQFPLVSVVMPVYNSGPYIKETLQSLLDQSFTNFELIICDDASTDDSLEIIEKFSDDRIRIIRSAANKGQAYQLNTGIAASQGELIAIMHSDDICMPERFKKQVNFLEHNPEIGIVGCNVKLIGNWQKYYPGSEGEWNYAEDFNLLRWQIFFGVPVLHSAVMFRKAQWVGLKLMYDQDMVPAEDYDIWSRAIQRINFSNVQEFLMQYRLHDRQISVIAANKELEAVNKIRRQMIDLFLAEETSAFKKAFYSFLYEGLVFTELSDQWFYQFNQWGKKQGYFPLDEFKKFISRRYGQYLSSLKKIPITHIFKPAVLDILGWSMYKSLLIKAPLKRILGLS